jgi:hypothetical protein
MNDAEASANLARKEWREAGKPPPKITSAFWYALGDGAREQVQRHLRHYFNWIEPSALEAMLPTTGFAGSPGQLKDVLRRFEDLGFDEVHLIPTTSDVNDIARVAEMIG